MEKYTLISGSRYKTVYCNCVTQAIAKAVEMESDLQPASGVWVEDYYGKTIGWIRNGKDIWEC